MGNDLEIKEGLSYSQLLRIYKDNFSLGNLNCSFKNKIALISMVCHITNELKKKKPDVTHYKVLRKIADGTGVPDSYVKVISVICDDFAYECDEFITFDLSNQEMIKSIKTILNGYLPF